jgi:hypothetical protein
LRNPTSIVGLLFTGRFVASINQDSTSVSMALNKPQVDWRLQCHFPDTLDLLAERDMKRYRAQRRLIGPLYHISRVKTFETPLDDVIQRVIGRLQSLQGAEVDLKEWMHIIVVECLGAVVLSWSPGLLENGSDGGSGGHAYLGWRQKSVFGLFPGVVIARFLAAPVGRMFSNLWGITYKIPAKFKPFFIVGYPCEVASGRLKARSLTAVAGCPTTNLTAYQQSARAAACQ